MAHQTLSPVHDQRLKYREKNSNLLCAFVNAFFETAEHMITGSNGKGDDWHRGPLDLQRPKG